VIEIDRVSGISTALGEGPSWDAQRQVLWFVDMMGDQVHRLEEGGRLKTWAMPGSPAAALPADDGSIVVVMEKGTRRLDPELGTLSDLTPVPLHAEARFTEAKVDRCGRLVALSSHVGFHAPVGSIMRWDQDGSVRELDAGLVIGNGPTWSLDGETFYAADSMRDTIWQYDDHDGHVSGRRAFYSTTSEEGFPDGATLDADGCLWVVLHRSHSIVRLRPDGREDRRIQMPSPHITSLAFGGSGLADLYVTSLDPARIPGLPSDARAGRDDEAGHLYRVTGLGVTGVPEIPAQVTKD